MRNLVLTCTLIHPVRRQEIFYFPQDTFHPSKAQVPENRSLPLMLKNVIIHHYAACQGPRNDLQGSEPLHNRPSKSLSLTPVRHACHTPRKTDTQLSNAQDSREGRFWTLLLEEGRGRERGPGQEGCLWFGEHFSWRRGYKEREQGAPAAVCPPHLGLRAALLGHLEHELLQQLHGALVHDGQRRALQLAAEVDVQMVQHLLGGAQRVAAQQRVPDVAHGEAAAARGPGSASRLPPRAPRTRPPPWRQRGRDPASRRRAGPGPWRPPAAPRSARSGCHPRRRPAETPGVRPRRPREPQEPDAAERTAAECRARRRRPAEVKRGPRREPALGRAPPGGSARAREFAPRPRHAPPASPAPRPRDRLPTGDKGPGASNPRQARKAGRGSLCFPCPGIKAYTFCSVRSPQ